MINFAIYLIFTAIFMAPKILAAHFSVVDFEVSELQALRIADAIFLKRAINPEYYRMSMQRLQDKYIFLYFDKKLDWKDLGDYLRHRFPGCSPFLIDIGKDGSILKQDYLNEK
jgi:hypothetical protein